MTRLPKTLIAAIAVLWLLPALAGEAWADHRGHGVRGSIKLCDGPVCFFLGDVGKRHYYKTHRHHRHKHFRHHHRGHRFGHHRRHKHRAHRRFHRGHFHGPRRHRSEVRERRRNDRVSVRGDRRDRRVERRVDRRDRRTDQRETRFRPTRERSDLYRDHRPLNPVDITR